MNPRTCASRRFTLSEGSKSMPISLAAVVVGEADQQFAEIPALQQADEGFGRVVEAVDDVLAVSELAALDQRRYHRAELGLAVALVADDEALDLEPLAHDGAEVGAGARRLVIVFRDHAAHHHADEIVEAGKDRLLYGAADILEIDV